MKSRIYLLIVAVLLLAVAFAVTAGTPKEEEQKLVVWWWGEQDEPGLQNWMNENVEIYEEMHPNVTVEAVLQNTDQMIPAFWTAGESGSGSDVQFLWAGTMTTGSVFRGYIAPFSDFVSEEELPKLVALPSEVSFGGKTYCPSFYNTICVLGYNKKIFKEAGLNPENPPEDWDSFLSACEKIKRAGYIPIALGNKSYSTSSVIWMEGSFLYQNLDTLPEYLNFIVGDVDRMDMKYTEGWYKLEELWKKGYINNDINSLEFYQAYEDYFISGKAAMSIVPGGIYRKAYEIHEGQVGVMKSPIWGTGKSAGKSTVWRKNWSVTEWSPNKELAVDFIKFMSSAERSAAMYEATGGGFPGSMYFDVSAIKDKPGRDLYDNLMFSFDGITGTVVPYFVDEQGFWIGSQKFFAGEYSARDMAKHLDDAIAKWKADNPDEYKKFKSWSDSLNK
jgi:multiple sugar transport system substrate-binding protein